MPDVCQAGTAAHSALPSRLRRSTYTGIENVIPCSGWVIHRACRGDSNLKLFAAAYSSYPLRLPFTIRESSWMSWWKCPIRIVSYPALTCACRSEEHTSELQSHH